MAELNLYLSFNSYIVCVNRAQVWPESVFNYVTYGDTDSPAMEFSYNVTLDSLPEIHLRGGTVLFTKSPANKHKRTVNKIIIFVISCCAFNFPVTFWVISEK